MPSRTLLHATAQNAIDWLAANCDWFDPEKGALPTMRDKPVVELALLLRPLRDSGSAYTGLEELVALVREVAARPERRYMPRPTHEHLVAGAFLFAAVHREPGENPVEHRRLQRLVDIRMLDTLEQPVYRVLEDRLALDWAGLRHRLPSWQALAGRSILGSKPNAGLLDESGAYQLTHAAMYLTALGTRAAMAHVDSDERHRQRISALLVRFVEEQHWDLVGELLLSWSALALGPSPVCEGAWRSLLQAVEPGGAIPQPRRAGEPEPKPEPRVPFLERYHTTLVIVHAADSWRRDCASLPPPRSRAGARAVERSLLRDMADVEAAWLAEMLDPSGHAEPRILCGVLVGLWICGAMSAQARRRLSDATGAAIEAAHAIGDWTPVPAGLAIVAYGLMVRSHAVPDGLAAFVGAAEAALQSSSRDDLALCEKRVLLHRLGRAEEPVPAPLRSVVEIAERTALEPTAANVERLRLTTESSAAYGTRPVGLAASDRWVSELLLALAAERAHSFDLVGASRLIRASVHIDAGAAGQADLVELLLAHQRSTGGFGLFGNATPADPREDGSAMGRDLLLGLSVDCLWTLAEAATPWRLTSGIGSTTRR